MPESLALGGRHRLAGGGVAVLIDLADDPAILHWGRDLGDEPVPAELLVGAVAHSMFDEPVRPGLLPQLSRGWRGRPAVVGSRGGRAFSPRFVLTAAGGDIGSIAMTLADQAAGLEVLIETTLDATGLLATTTTIRNTGADEYALERADAVLPVPAQAVESIDTTGRWAREKHPQRRPVQQGTWVRSGRHGRTGHDAPVVLGAGTAGFNWRSGEVWAVHLGWSGDHESFVERLPGGSTTFGAGELLHPGEVVLAQGAAYRSPVLYAAWSDTGLDGVSARFHDWMRARPRHPRRPRPVVLNTWEAVYFAHDLDTLTELATTAAEVGVERFVLDDGWFLGRRHDRAGLGDWFVDEAVWPGGLQPLIDAVTERGMEFGLWVEPEMVNEDSDVIRAHPDWISGPGGRTPIEWRNQQVIDLVHPDAFEYILNRLDTLLTEYPDVAYLKWDQNRDQLELGHDGRPATHEQTLAAYRLFDELRERHPRLEIESCSSGGARVDLGILQRTDRLWASDTNDALERRTIQRWTELLVPPELVGAHVGPTTSHSTGRTHDIGFRIASALGGHFGIEWDIRQATDADRAALTEAIAFYKRERGLLHGGRSVRMDHPDPAIEVTGVVAHDASRAVFVVAALATSADEVPSPARLGGLDPAHHYRVGLALPLAPGATMHRSAPAWLDAGVTASGVALGELGLPMPVLNPEQALVLLVEVLP